jgi:DNA-binding MarR family transcriptional regulator/GNAT superfamily N-acetyltransferase
MLDDIARLRRFNRIVTREIGVLDTSYLGRGRPLGAARVLQLVTPSGTDLADIRRILDLDTGLLSRLLRSLEEEGLIKVETHADDRRRRVATLTPEGEAEWRAYEALGYARATQVLTRAGSRAPEVVAAMDLIASVMLRDQVTIRNADPDDPAANYLVGSYFRYLLESFPWLSAEMFSLPLSDAPKLRPPHGAFLIAWSDDMPVGCASFRPLEPGIAEVKRLWVEPMARGQGLARKLMQAIESRAREMGFSRLKLDTNSALVEAIALYRATGWTDTAPYTGLPADTWLTKPL